MVRAPIEAPAADVGQVLDLGARGRPPRRGAITARGEISGTGSRGGWKSVEIRAKAR